MRTIIDFILGAPKETQHLSDPAIAYAITKMAARERRVFLTGAALGTTFTAIAIIALALIKP